MLTSVIIYVNTMTPLLRIKAYVYVYIYDFSFLYMKTTFSNLKLFSSVFRRRQWQPTPVLLPGKSHGRRSLVGCSPWGHEESDTTE